MPIATVQLPNGKIADIEVPQGATPQEIESFVMSQPEFQTQIETQSTQQTPEAPQQSAQDPQSFQERNLGRVANFAKGVPQGLGNAAIGGVQAATDVGEKAAQLIEKLYFGDNLQMNTFGNRLADQVKARKAEQAQLPMSERAGIFVGEVAPTIAAGGGTGARVAAATGSRIAGLAAGSTIGGATSSAVSMQEEAGLGNRAVETAKGAATGAAFGTALGVGGKVISSVGGGLKETAQAIKSGFKAKPIEELGDIGQKIADDSNALYKAVDESGATLRPEAIKQLQGNIRQAVVDGGSLFKTNHPKTIGILRDIEKDIQEKGGVVTVSQLDSYRKALSTAAQDSINSIGKTTDDGRRLKGAIRAIDQYIDESPADKILNLPKDAGDEVIKTYREAQKQWGTYAKFDTIANLVKKADNDPNRLKTLVKNFVDNDRKTSGFSEAQIASLRKASENTNTAGFLKQFGKFGFDLGSGRNLGNTALPVGSAMFGGAKGMGLATVGTLARQAQKLEARGRIEDVLNLIRGQEPQISSKVIQKLSPKTRDFVLTNILTQSATQGNNDAQASETQNMTEDQIRQQMLQQNQSIPSSYSQKELKERPAQIKQRYYR